MIFLVYSAVFHRTFDPCNFDGSGRFARNYPILLTVHILMIFVYLLIFYTLKTVYDAMEKEHFARSMKEQIALQKKQYEFLVKL